MKLHPSVLEPFHDLTIGFFNDDNMDGYMDEIRMYSEALDAESILRLWLLQ